MTYRFINNQHSLEICKAAIRALGVLTNGNYLNLFSCLVVTRRFTNYYQILTVGHLIVSQRRFMAQNLSVLVFMQKRVQNPVKNLRQSFLRKCLEQLKALKCFHRKLHFNQANLKQNSTLKVI